MGMNAADELRALDRAHLWHPFTRIAQIEAAPFPIMTRAEGSYLYDNDNRAYLDGISSWWCVNLGHRHARIVAAVRAQLETLDQSILGGMSHPGAIRLAARLAALTPGPLCRVIYASDGASAVEAALKIALQYWVNVGRPERQVFVSLADAYHGDTLGALGVGYVERFHHSFSGVLHASLRAESPHCFHCRHGMAPDACALECFGAMERIIARDGRRIAAVIVEPICQGAAGMRIYPARYLARLRALCDTHEILLIADEIAVGFGRTGRMFACEHADIAPDILCLGKALTGGMLPLSATVTTDAVYATFRDDGARDRTFYHGHTTCGSPITTAAALAACDVFTEERIIERARPSMQVLAGGFAHLAAHPEIHRTAALGMMGVLELTPEAGGAQRALAVAGAALARGLFVRPLGPILYLWPPLTATPEETARMHALLAEAIEATR